MSTDLQISVRALRAELIGPVIAPNAAIAARLIRAAHARLPVPHRISVPSENCEAAEILIAQGFRYTRSLRHMVRGLPPVAARERIYARTNLGQG